MIASLRLSLAGTTAMLTLVGLLAAPLAAHAQSVSASRIVTFVDDRRGRSLSVELDPQSPDLGTFAFLAPGRGVYTGSLGSAMQVRSPSRVTIRFAGQATLEQQLDITNPFVQAPPPTTVAIRLLARLNPTRHFATAILTEGSVAADDHENIDLDTDEDGDHDDGDVEDADPLRFHLVARTLRNRTDSVLLAFERATLTSDFRSLYALMNSDVTGSYTVDSFVADGTRQLASTGRVVRLRRLSSTAPQTDDAGVTLFTAEYDALVSPPAGADARQHYVAYFIDQGGTWKLWFTSPLP